MSMNRWIPLGIVAAMAATLVSRSALAEVPALLPVQGHLSDAAGAPLDGKIEVVFRLFNQEQNGVKLFEETQSVNVDQGEFIAYLGSLAGAGDGGTALDLDMFRVRS